MATRRRALGMGTSIVAAAAALLLIGTSAASAHHCYKDEWQSAAYEQHLKGGTPWMPLSDMGRAFLIPADLQDACGYVADEVVAGFMDERGLTQEPLIHTRATVGGGAYAKGKAPKPFSYLTEADFAALTLGVEAGVEKCVKNGS